MVRSLFAAVLAVVLSVSVMMAEEVKGKVKSVDSTKNTITLTVGDKDQTINVAKEAEIFSLGKAKKGQPAPKEALAGGLGGVKEGTEVTVTTEKKEGKEVATSIKVETAKKKKDK